MKISRFIPWCISIISCICRSIDGVAIMVFISIIGLIAAIAVPNFIMAQKQIEKNKIAEQQKTQESFKVGDVVTVKGLDRKGTVNYLGDNGYVDVIITGNNGEPTILKGINSTLISK